MPTYSKKQLRRDLAAMFMRDLIAGAPQPANLTSPINTTPVTALAQRFADSNASGQNLYQNAWLYVEGSTAQADAAPTMYQYAIGSYNSASGAFISGAYAIDAHNSISRFEVHTRVSPLDKDKAIDDTITRIRTRQEVALPTLDGNMLYTIDGAGSPFIIDQILDVHLAANPTSSVDYDLRHIQDWNVVSTATGNQLRIQYPVQGSQRLLLDCILVPTLGNELATIALPSERWILAGAAARCYDFMIQAAPAQQVAMLTQRRMEWAQEFTRLCTRHQPQYDKPVKYHDVIRGNAGNLGWNGDPFGSF